MVPHRIIKGYIDSGEVKPCRARWPFSSNPRTPHWPRCSRSPGRSSSTGITKSTGASSAPGHGEAAVTQLIEQSGGRRVVVPPDDQLRVHGTTKAIVTRKDYDDALNIAAGAL